MSAHEDVGELVPEGTFLRPDDSVRRFAGGTVLVGGSPLWLLKLGAQGARVFGRWVNGGEALRRNAGEQRLARRLLDAGLLHPESPRGRFTLADLTLVTPVKDNASGVHRLLEATDELSERIIVDDGSVEPLPEAALRHEKPLGPAAARNAGWQRVRTELIAFVDSDVVPETGWLDAILPLFSDPEVAAVAPRIRSRPGDAPLERYEQDRSALDLGSRPAPVRPMSRVSYVPGAALVVRRSALAELGGFDTRLRFGEDVDLVWRLAASGHTVRYAPESVVWHDPRAGLLEWMRQRFEYGTSAASLSARHPGLLCCAKVSRWSALSWGLLASGRPVTALATAAVTTALFPRALRGRGIPATEALRLAGVGHLGAGRILAEATRRTWWPPALVAALFGGRARAVTSAVLLPCLIESAGKGPSWALLRLLDDLSYGAGVWAGCLKERTIGPLRPQFTDDSLCRGSGRRLPASRSIGSKAGRTCDRSRSSQRYERVGAR
ncbi:mycofactocin system glycosyltransferase [Halopolyspora algeriensis]|uniref:Mycofactocin system glycosyltransferase n=1 Tax=Halopolyspora algeriensis TaxID=1500506 RepID=A0A368VI54_9ACTN|nr:mycofactocin biosynthesis glycosyltransferase MftF [Halopolyspora algeriensis]RCW40965.1 mycofactocin system glycosyltransferase [Halopolyspora algeriensis]TQM53951.1 mycofactocin system glycosyltransferase [Halopolyspora algeriensis]